MRDLLLHATRLPPDATFAYAADLAAALDGRLDAVFVREPVPMVAGTLLPAASTIVEAWAGDALDRARAATDEIAAFAAARGVDARWRVAQGPLPAVLGEAMRWHDVLVTARDAEHPWGEAGAIGRLVVELGTPVLALPPELPGTPRMDTIAVAWNGSREATRALHAALPWLARARRVVIFRGEPRAAEGAVLEPVPFDLDDYLRRHGLRAEYGLLDGDDDSVGAALLDGARHADADLLVMGGHGRSRFAEWILGGVTRHVLRHATLPVLLRH